MTVCQFAEKINKSCKTVNEWITKGLIPGAILEKDYVPEAARAPYTKARAKTAKGIYYSMVNATKDLKHIVPSLYKITQEEFDGYIDDLIEAKLIRKRLEEGVTYYDATLFSFNSDNTVIMNVIKSISAGIMEGAMNSVIN